MRSLLATAAVLPFLALTVPASAGDVVVGGETRLWYDSNVYATSSNEISDFSFNVAPRVDLSERFGSVDASLMLKPTYELYFDESDLRGFNYDADGQISWHPAPTTTISLSDTFARFRQLRGYGAEGTGGQQAVRPGRERYTRNIAQLSALHRTSPKGQIQITASYGLWDFSSDRRPNQDTYTGAVHYSRQVAPRTRVGGLVSFARQAFDYQLAGGSHTDYYNLSFTYEFKPAETFTFRASAGPTLTRRPPSRTASSSVTRQAAFLVNGLFNGTHYLVGVVGSCPLLPGGQAYVDPSCDFVPFISSGFLRLNELVPLTGVAPEIDRNEWTYFADVALSKEWERASIEFSYKRDQGSSSAIDYSTLADTVSIFGTYTVWRELSFHAGANWENREQAQDIPAARFLTLLDTLPATPTQPLVNNLVPVGLVARGGSLEKQTVRSLTLRAGGVYELNERMRFRATVGWNDQEASERSGFGDSNRLFAVIGFEMELEPFRW